METHLSPGKGTILRHPEERRPEVPFAIGGVPLLLSPVAGPVQRPCAPYRYICQSRVAGRMSDSD